MTAKRLITMALVLSSLGFSATTASAAIVPPSAIAQPATPTAAARVFANCTALNKVYPHGVGRKGAKDRVSGSSKPVTNFAVSTAIYNANTKSDRDKDGVACEKR